MAHSQAQHDLSATRVTLIVCAASSLLFLGFLDSTIVGASFGAISDDLGAGAASSWVATAYLLGQASTLVAWTRASDIFGRKSCLVAGAALFGTASLSCALAQTVTQLAVLRGLQGVGGSLFTAAPFVILADVAPVKRRGLFLVFTQLVIVTASAVGPVMGAAISNGNWRIIFWINLPMIAIVLLLITFLPLRPVEGSISSRLSSIDWVAFLLVVSAVALLLLAVSWGGLERTWPSAAVVAPLVIGVVLLVLLAVWECRSSLPNRNVIGSIFTGIGSGLQYCVLFFLPQYSRIVQGRTTITSALLIMPFALSCSVTVVIGGQVVARYQLYRAPLCLGFFTYALGLGLLALLNGDSSSGFTIGLLTLAGFGEGFVVQNQFTAVQAAVSQAHAALVTGLQMFYSLTGGMIILAVGTSLVNNALRSLDVPSNDLLDFLAHPLQLWHDETSLPPSIAIIGRDTIVHTYLSGFRRIFYVAAGMAFVAGAAALLLIQSFDLDAVGEKQRAEDEGEVVRQDRNEMREAEEVKAENKVVHAS